MNRFALRGFALVCALALAAPTVAQTSSTSPANTLRRPAASPAASRSSNVADLREQLANNVGYRVYLQEWNPMKPDQDEPTSVIDKPSGISGPINALWDAVRQFLTDPNNPSSVPALLGKGNLIAKGVTLYSITFTVNPLSDLSLLGPDQGIVTAGQNGSGPRPQSVIANSFKLHLHIPGTKLDFRSTTPDVNGIGLTRDADPKLSAQIDLDVTLGLAVGAPGQPYLQITDVQVVAQKPKVDSGNFTGDILVGITDFLSDVAYGKSFNALLDQVLSTHNLAADPAHGGFAFGAAKTLDVKGMANGYLKPVNDAIAASGATRYARTGVWVKTERSGQMLIALFAPQALPLPPVTGSMSGTVQFDSTIPAGKMPSSCGKLVANDRIDVEVQLGPRPVFNVDPFNYGPVPKQRLSVAFSGQPVQNGRCTYALNGLAIGIPNSIEFMPPALAQNGSFGSVEQYIHLTPANWRSPVATAGAIADRNLVASMDIASNPGAGAMKANAAGLAHQQINPSDPEARASGVQNAGQPAPNWGAPAATGSSMRPASSAAATTSQPHPSAAPSSLGSQGQRQ
jgi:hypothetical protein